MVSRVDLLRLSATIRIGDAMFGLGKRKLIVLHQMGVLFSEAATVNFQPMDRDWSAGVSVIQVC